MVEIIGGWIVRSDIFDFESQVKKFHLCYRSSITFPIKYLLLR